MRLPSLTELRIGKNSKNVGTNPIGDDGAEILAGLPLLTVLELCSSSLRIGDTNITLQGLKILCRRLDLTQL